jgi:6-pyruvoyl-tetrahydropterin synthase
MKRICEVVLDNNDHQNLNELFVISTLEIIADWIYMQLKEKIPVTIVIFYKGEGK